MGGIGFGQGLMQGMQQAQDRQFQMQYLKLQQDEAKYKHKQMETQDQLNQLNLQSLQRKIEAETRLPSQQAALLGPQASTLGPGEQGPMPVPSEIDRSKLASFLMAAQQAGQDPDQLLTLMSMADPRIQAIHESLKPEAFVKLGEGEQLISSRTKQSVASVPPKKEKPISVAPGGTLVDPTTGLATFTAPAAPAKPPDFGDRTESAAAVYGQQHYGKPMTFTELLATDPIQAMKIRQQTMVDEPATIAGAKTAANIQEQQKQLLTPTEANELGVPFGTTKGEAAGTMPITAQQRASLAAYDTTRAIMADIEQYSKKVNTASGGLSGKAAQGAKLWGAWTQSDPDAAMLQSKAGELATVARSLGEKGALADKDVARAAALVPGVMDTREVAQQKLRDMRALIDAGEASFRKSLGIDARAPAKSKTKAPVVKPPVQDPLAAIPVPKGLTPQQEQVWRESYAKQRQDLQQKMKPKGNNKPSYQMGTPYVPQTGEAQLHQGEMVIPQQEAEQLRQQGFGLREDGTPKGMGFFGLLRSMDPNARPGTFSSELSYNSTIDGKDLFYPLLVPTLSLQDLNHIMSGKEPTDAMHRKAIDHALERIQAGKSPFAGPGEQLPLPTR